MKKFYLTTILTFLFSFSLLAQTLYWVGGSGNWDDPAHWANSINGPGGAGVPNENSAANISQKSVTSNDVITISNNITISSLSIKNTPGFTLDFKGGFMLINNDFIATPKGNFIFNLNNATVIAGKLPQFSKKVVVPSGSFIIGSENKQWLNGAWQNENSPQQRAFSVNLDITQPVCNGGTGSCFATASGGTGVGFSFFYTGGIFGTDLVAVNPATGLTAGGYVCLAIDQGNGDFQLPGFNINDPPPLSVIFINNPPFCPGSSDGSIQALIFGGTAPTGYTANWSTGFTETDVITSTLVNIPAGPYALAVIDGNGCTATRFDTLIDPEPIMINALVTDISCNGFSNGSIFLNPTSGNPGPFTYLWSPGGETTSFLTNQFAGIDTVHVEDINGCPKDSIIIINEPTLLTASITGITHLLCNSDCSIGEAIVTPADATPPYTYQWLDAGNNPIPGLTDSIATGLCAGAYAVVVSDANGCDSTLSNIIITQPTLLTASDSTKTVRCYGESNGEASVTPTGGTPPYTYLWSPGGQTDSAITGLTAGTYIYSVNDNNMCQIIDSVIVTQPDSIHFLLTTADLLCNGDINGQADVSNVSGGDGNYSYAWLNNAGDTVGTGISINTLSAGLYSITVSDENGCAKIVGFEIIEPLSISLVLSADSASCFGFADGAVHVIASGGTVTVDYTYAWVDGGNNPIDTTADVSGLPAGTYTVTVSDDNSCTIVDFVTIGEPTPIVFDDFTITDVTCNGDSTGAISVSVSGGSPPYSFTWFAAGFTANSQNIDSLLAGTYTLTVKDINDCVIIQGFMVNEPAPITFDDTITDVNCFGDTTGAITIIVMGGNGGYSYDWRDNANTQISTTNQITNVVAGDYTLTVTDSLGCSHFEAYTINESPEFFFNAVVTPVTCFNDSDGAIDLFPVGGTPGYTFDWTANNGFTSTNQNISNLAPGNYKVKVKDLLGCEPDTNIILENPPELVVDGIIVNDITCNGDMDGSIEISVSGGVPPYGYFWDSPNGFSSTDQDIFNLEGGAYNLLVTDSNDCTFTNSFTVSEPAPITFNDTITHVNCFGDTTGAISVVVNGGNGGYSYDWRDTANTQISTTEQINNVVAGNYTLTVTDSLGCSHFEAYTINESPEFFFNAVVTPVTCFNDSDGAIDLFPVGGTPGYTFDWTANNGFTSTNQNISNLASGNYEVKVEDLLGCEPDTTIELSNPPGLVLDNVIVNDISCNGEMDGSIEISVSGGVPPYGYLWESPNGFNSTDQDIFNLESGDYFLTITDSIGCSMDSLPFSISEPTPIAITSATITDILCKGDSTGSIIVVVSGGSGGFTYEWFDATSFQVGDDDTLANVIAGDYTLIVTDDQNCTDTSIYTITEPATAISIDGFAIVNVSCAGDSGQVSVDISGGSVGVPGDYTFVWTNLAGTVVGNTQTITIPADTYIVTVADTNLCTATDTAIVTEPDPITVIFEVTEPTCADDLNGKVIAIPSGGTTASGNYIYFWEDFPPPGPIDSITNIGAGTYQVEVFDDNFCSVIDSITVNEPDSIDLSFTFTEPICNGENGQIEVSATGGTVALDYQYEWMDAGMNVIDTIALLTGVAAGDYTITVTDDNGCQMQEIVTLTEPTAITYTPTIVQITCAGDDDGSIAVLVIGGNPPYTYEWTDELGISIGTDTIVENLAPGNYTFTTTDDNGCILSETFTIITENEITATFTQFELGDCSISPPCIGAAYVEPTGGTGIYMNYQWVDILGNDLGINNDTATGLCSGSYFVTITDTDGCTGTITVLIDDEIPEDITVTVEDPTCNAEPGTAIAVYECVDEPCSIEWFDATTNTSTGLTTDTVQLFAGEYFVEITNGTGCKNHFAFTVTEPLIILPNLSATGISCNGTCDGTATASPTGGSGAFTYLWNDPLAQTSAVATDLCAGTYQVLITDALDTNCFVVGSVIVDDIAPITSLDTITHVSCNGESDGIIELFPSGGSGLFTYTWNPAPPIGDGTSTGSGLAIGDYTIQIIDAENPNCFIEVTYTITQPDVLDGTTETVQSSCGNADGEATVNPFGGTPPYAYLWTDTASQTTQTATNLIAGLYNVTVTDSLGCFKVFTDAVSDQDADTLDLVIEPALCFGDSSVVIAVYDCLNPTCIITWYDEMGNLLPLTGDTVTLADGNYWVGIENSLGCKWFLPFEINSTAPIDPNLFVINESCFGPCDGIASVNPIGGNGGYTYLWAPEPPTGQGTNEASGLCIGTWAVTITDMAGCDTTVTFEIGPYTSIVPNLTIIDVGCSGESSGTAEVAPTDGNGFYTYLWTPEPLTGQGTNSATGLFAGEWNITITDTSGCDTTVVFTVIEPEALDADSVVTNATCNDDPGDGEIILMVSGGTPPFNYQWFDATGNDLGVNNDTISGLTEGIYHCVVLDSNFCSETFVAIISENSSETIVAESQDVVCNGANDGMAWVTYVCGDAPCTVAWFDEFGVDLGLNTDTITGLGPGTYIVGVTNNSGCVVYQQVEVNEPPELILTTTLTDASCAGVCDGELVATVTGGVTPYTFLWTPEPGSGQGTSTASDLCAGDYSLLLTDAAGCSITFDFTITELEGIISNLQTSDVNCYEVCDGWATVNPVGVSGNFSYLWSPEPAFGQGTDSVAGLCAGDWSILITDIDNGCNITETFTIFQPDSIWVSDTLIVTPECPEDSSGSIAVTVVGGTEPYNYQWFVDGSPVSGATESFIIDVIPGDYTIEITDANACTRTESYLLESISALSANAGNDSSYCDGLGPVQLIGSGNGLTHVWLDSLGNFITMGDTLTVDPPPGIHTYIFEVSDGICTASDTAFVEVYENPIVDAGPDYEIITDETVVIGGSPTAADDAIVAWSPALGLSDSTATNPTASPFETTEYIVFVNELIHGCSTNDTMVVTVVPDFVPNDGFTPNGDGINDVWVIGNLEQFPNVEVIIFNRWGQVLFSSTGYSIPWDGKFEGKDVPVGTFYYVIDLHDEKYPEPFTGPLTIMR